MHLGYPDKGHISTYYPDSPDITQGEIEAISTLLKEKKLMPENTRLRQTESGNYELLIASAVTDPKVKDVDETEFELDGALKGKRLRIVYGDYKNEMVSSSSACWLVSGFCT
jgi:dipeptidyl-peptidase III